MVRACVRVHAGLPARACPKLTLLAPLLPLPLSSTLDDIGGTALRASFHGRLFDGHRVPLPTSVIGLVLREELGTASMGGVPAGSSAAARAAPAPSASSGGAAPAAASEAPISAARLRLMQKAAGAAASAAARARGGDSDGGGSDGGGSDGDFAVAFDNSDEDGEEEGGSRGRGSAPPAAAQGTKDGTGGAGVEDTVQRHVWRVDRTFQDVTYWCVACPVRARVVRPCLTG